MGESGEELLKDPVQVEIEVALAEKLKAARREFGDSYGSAWNLSSEDAWNIQTAALEKYRGEVRRILSEFEATVEQVKNNPWLGLIEKNDAEYLCKNCTQILSK